MVASQLASCYPVYIASVTLVKLFSYPVCCIMFQLAENQHKSTRLTLAIIQTITPSLFHIYLIAGKFDKFGKSSMIHQTKLVLTINNLLADQLICQTFPHQTFPLYSSQFEILYVVTHGQTPLSYRGFIACSISRGAQLYCKR